MVPVQGENSRFWEVNRCLMGNMEKEAGLRVTSHKMSLGHGKESHCIFPTWAKSQDEFYIIHHPTGIY